MNRTGAGALLPWCFLKYFMAFSLHLDVYIGFSPCSSFERPEKRHFGQLVLHVRCLDNFCFSGPSLPSHIVPSERQSLKKKKKSRSKPGCWLGWIGKNKAKLSSWSQNCLCSSFQHWGAHLEWGLGCLQGFSRPAERNSGWLQLCSCTQYLMDFTEHSLDQSTTFSLRNLLNVYNLVGFSCGFSFIFILQLCWVQILLYFGFQLLLKSIIKASIVICLSITCKCIAP